MQGAEIEEVSRRCDEYAAARSCECKEVARAPSPPRWNGSADAIRAIVNVLTVRSCRRSDSPEPLAGVSSLGKVIRIRLIRQMAHKTVIRHILETHSGLIRGCSRYPLDIFKETVIFMSGFANIVKRNTRENYYKLYLGQPSGSAAHARAPSCTLLKSCVGHQN